MESKLTEEILSSLKPDDLRKIMSMYTDENSSSFIICDNCNKIRNTSHDFNKDYSYSFEDGEYPSYCVECDTVLSQMLH